MARMSATNSKTSIHPKGSGIKIRCVTNQTIRNGERQDFGESFLVTVPAKKTGTGRKRKQFAKLKEAEEWAEEQFSGHGQLGEQFFELESSERRQAVAALHLLKPRSLSLQQFVTEALAATDALPQGVSLLDAVKFAAPRMKPAGGDRTVDQVVEEMISSKETRRENGQLREPSLRDFRSRAKVFAKQFGAELIKNITALKIKQWLVGMKLSTRSNKNHLNIVSEILRSSMQRKYIGADPLADLTDDDRKELCGHEGEQQEPHILTLEQAEKLLLTAVNNPKLDLLAYSTLALFCGIRSAELLKLKWEHVSEKYVIIPPGIAKKRKIRHVDLPDNAKAWLALCPRKTGPIVDASYAAFGRRFFNFRKRAGFENWENNYMRHSFGSFHFAKYGNALETARQMGHSQGDDVLFTHYRQLATKEQGEAFFQIHPPKEAANIIRFQKSVVA